MYATAQCLKFQSHACIFISHIRPLAEVILTSRPSVASRLPKKLLDFSHRISRFTGLVHVIVYLAPLVPAHGHGLLSHLHHGHPRPGSVHVRRQVLILKPAFQKRRHVSPVTHHQRYIIHQPCIRLIQFVLVAKCG